MTKKIKESSYQKLGKAPFERYSAYVQECTGCGCPSLTGEGFVGTWYIEGDKYCQDCVREGNAAAEMIKERNKHLIEAAKLELDVINMGYEEFIEPVDYEYYLRQENRAKLEKKSLIRKRSK